jgi:hypothetical protein
MSSFFRASGLAVLACAVLVIAAGCAEQRAPIDRVQAMALSKHFFVGDSLSDPSDDPQFYMGARIIDVPYGVNDAPALVQAIGSISRVRFEIQEKLLIARLTYDRIQNTSGGNTWGAKATTNGQVVAEFNIESHFDIIRDYNPQTGEQLNVVVENTTDRPWYEREFFRVDWSKNLVTDAYDFDLFSQAQLFGVQFDPLSYYIQDPSDPNAPVFSDADGYLDVTQKVFTTPQSIDTPFGSFPSCFIMGAELPGGTYPAVTCNPAELTVRLAFKKVVDDDYEPEDFTGVKMAAFGWFSDDRFGYDKNYGILDQNWHRFASRYNIWQKSHIAGSQCAVDFWRDASGNVQNYKVDAAGKYVFDGETGLPIPDPAGQPFTLSAVGRDVHRDANGNKTEDECEFRNAAGDLLHPGSRCDEFTNKCDLPLYERATKTIPFYYGPGAAPDLFPSTAHALNSWNLAVKRAAQLGTQVEANRVGHQLPAPFLTSEADLALDQQGSKTVQDVFVLCHNPVASVDDPACGPTGLAPRRGDMRYNMVDIIPTPQYKSPWGIMTDFDDPLTGEKVQGSINEWGDVLDVASQSTEDLLRWVNGEISNQDIASGQYLQAWVSADKLGTASHKPAVLTTDEIKKRIASIDRSNARLNGLVPGVPLAAATTASAQNLATALGPSLDSAFEGARQSLMGTTWETQLVTPDDLQMAGFNPNTPLAGGSSAGSGPAAMASPLQGLNPRLRKWSRALIDRALVSKGMCMLGDAPEPDSLVGLARQAAALFPLPATNDPNYPAKLYTRNQELHQWLREQFHLGVIAHEMGHSMGLRHNFAGSYDALNYHTEYWQLRTRNGAEHYCGYPGQLDAMTPHTNGADCVGPRWVDPVTEQETNDLIWKWGSSTVMDYPGDQTQDTNDIGPYDKAAMRFGYADVVDVEKNFKAVSTGGGGLGGSGADLVNGIQLLDGWGGIFGYPYGTTGQSLSGGMGGNHYSTYADKYGVLGDCSTKRPGYNGDPNSPLANVCSGPNLDYQAERDMKNVPKANTSDAANFAVDPQMRVRHPYMFAGDEFVDIGNVPVFRFDAGADSYEQFQYLVSTYENRYIFNNFRRDRVTFNSYDTVVRIEDRYWDKIKSMTKTLALGVEQLTTQAPPGTPPGQNPLDPTLQAGMLMPLALGASDGLAMFARAMTRPEPGVYDTSPAGPGGPPITWGAVGTQLNASTKLQFGVALGSGEGRYVHNDYDYSQGYWWSDYQTQSGSAYEKDSVPFYLVEAYNDFISNSKDDYIDGRYKNLSYLSVYPEQVRRLLANVMATQSATLTLDNGTAAQIFTVAPYAVPGKGGATEMDTVQYLPWEAYDPNDPSTQSLAYPAGAVLLDPLVGWEQQYPALLEMFWFGRTSLSLDFVDMVRILSPGDAGSDAFVSSATVRYRDPVTGIEYMAKGYGQEWVNPAIGYPVEKGIGARMLQHANYLASLAYQVSGSPDPATGELTYARDGQGNPIPQTTQGAQDAAAMLKGYSSNLDYARRLTLFMGYLPHP